MGKLLFSEQPIVIDKQLALAVGFDEAAILQQIHYWCELHKGKDRHIKDGRSWTFNSAAGWRENFPFWGEDKIKKLLLRLEHLRVVISRNDMNQTSWDRTKWYTVDQDRLAAVYSERTFMGPQNQQVTEISQCAKRHDGSCKTAPSIVQNGTIDNAESHGQYHEVTQEVSQEAAADQNAPAAASSPLARRFIKQTLTPEIEAAILTLPPKHQEDARDVCQREDASDEIKLDALFWFALKLAAGKADGCGLLADAIKKKLGAKERQEQQQQAAAFGKAQALEKEAGDWWNRLPLGEKDFWRVVGLRRGGAKSEVARAYLAFVTNCNHL